MSDSVILPCLKEAAWGDGGHSVCRRLWKGERSAYMPWVGFGYDRPHTFEFLSRARLAELGRAETELERDALQNLHVRKASWKRVDAKVGFLKKLKMLACGDDFLAAERILDPDFMREAQKKLGARGLLAGVPRRSFLIVTDGEQGAEKLTPFVSMIAAQYSRAESAPISPALFAVKDGTIIGIVEAGAEAARRGPVGDDVAEPEEGAASVTMMVVRDETTGLEAVRILASSDDFEELARQVVSALAEAVTRYGSRPEFGGEITVVILAHTPEHVRDQLPRLEEHLKGLAAETEAVGRSGRPLRVSLQQQKRSSAF